MRRRASTVPRCGQATVDERRRARRAAHTARTSPAARRCSEMPAVAPAIGGKRCRERPEGGDERADQAVAREGRRALAVADDARQHRVLERQEHAHVAARRIERADKGDEQQRPEVGEPRRSRARSRPSAQRRRAAASGSGSGGRAGRRPASAGRNRTASPSQECPPAAGRSPAPADRAAAAG